MQKKCMASFVLPIALLPLETQGANTEQFSTKVDYDNTTTPENFECYAHLFSPQK